MMPEHSASTQHKASLFETLPHPCRHTTTTYDVLPHRTGMRVGTPQLIWKMRPTSIPGVYTARTLADGLAVEVDDGKDDHRQRVHRLRVRVRERAQRRWQHGPQRVRRLRVVAACADTWSCLGLGLRVWVRERAQRFWQHGPQHVRRLRVVAACTGTWSFSGLGVRNIAGAYSGCGSGCANARSASGSMDRSTYAVCVL